MALAQLQVLIPSGTGIPADRSLNTWDLSCPTLDASVQGDINGAFLDFYDTASAGMSQSLTAYMRNGIVGTDWVFRLLSRNAVDGVLTPFGETTVSMANLAGSGDTLPSEVAVRLSLHGTITGVQAVDRQRRGGPFLGPGWTVAAEDISSSRVVVSTSLLDDIALAAVELKAALVAGGCDLTVWSQVGLTSHPVIAGFVDNAFDTIRSRGTSATTRTLIDLS